MVNCGLSTAKNNSNNTANTKTWLKFCLFKYLSGDGSLGMGEQSISVVYFSCVCVLTSIMIWMQKGNKRDHFVQNNGKWSFEKMLPKENNSSVRFSILLIYCYWQYIFKYSDDGKFTIASELITTWIFNTLKEVSTWKSARCAQ